MQGPTHTGVAQASPAQRESLSRQWSRDQSQARANPRSGQTMIFLVMALVLLLFVVLWNFDVHKIIYSKSVTQNAGDAAAVMGARWQGITLNLIGELNVMHALALAAGDQASLDAVSNVQARLSYVGPMVAFMGAQQAAKNNGIHVHEDFTDRLREHADRVRYDYPHQTDTDGTPLFPPPWDHAWEDYANMLDTVGDNGIAAAPDNARLYSDFAGGHPLLDIGLYEAIAGRNWCWFHNNYRGYNATQSSGGTSLLHNYRNYPPTWWPDLPMLPHREYINSEIFGLGLRKITAALSQVDDDFIAGGATNVTGATHASVSATSSVWYAYADGAWGRWDSIDRDGPNGFPVVGLVRPQYDYAGADTVIRIEADITRVTPGDGRNEVHNTITWTAASKPFGALNDEQDRPNAFTLVLPAYADARLIPVGASSSPSGGAYNLPWREHIEIHLATYMRQGPSGLASGCWYCNQLDGDSASWESASFRRAGALWLDDSDNTATCNTGGGPGRPGGPGGGTRVAH